MTSETHAEMNAYCTITRHASLSSSDAMFGVDASAIVMAMTPPRTKVF